MRKRSGMKDILNRCAYDNQKYCKRLMQIRRNLQEVNDVLNGKGKCPR